MATGLTPVRARPYPLETDVPDVAADIHSLALSLENTANTYVGSLAGRAAVVPKVGDRYIVNGDGTPANNGAQYVWTGSAWIVVVPSWIALTLSGSVGTTAGAYTPAHRIVGDRVELCGKMTWSGAGSVTNWASVATAAFPASRVDILVDTSSTTATSMQINTAGQLLTPALPNGTTLGLDSISYRLV